jgi:DNA-directed RNA polymerase specialized sigma24 family protein
LTITQDSFDALLEWLDPDRDKAGQLYETIHAGLIRLFVSKGLADAEHWADETMDRVIKRLPEIRAEYVGPPVRYFIGVARNVVREARRPKEVTTDQPLECVSLKEVDSELAICLSKCLKSLAREKLELIYDYHVYNGHQKIESHREMAAELAISVGALRTRAHHLRAALEECVSQCMEERGNKSPSRSHNNKGRAKEHSLSSKTKKAN